MFFLANVMIVDVFRFNPQLKKMAQICGKNKIGSVTDVFYRG